MNLWIKMCVPLTFLLFVTDFWYRHFCLHCPQYVCCFVCYWGQCTFLFVSLYGWVVIAFRINLPLRIGHPNTQIWKWCENIVTKENWQWFLRRRRFDKLSCKCKTNQKKNTIYKTFNSIVRLAHSNKEHRE